MKHHRNTQPHLPAACDSQFFSRSSSRMEERAKAMSNKDRSKALTCYYLPRSPAMVNICQFNSAVELGGGRCINEKKGIEERIPKESKGNQMVIFRVGCITNLMLIYVAGSENGAPKNDTFNIFWWEKWRWSMGSGVPIFFTTKPCDPPWTIHFNPRLSDLTLHALTYWC